MDTLTTTPFSLIYNRFLSRITDDMYLELTTVDTYKMLEELLLNAIFDFEFPRINIFDYTLIDGGSVDEDDYYDGLYTFNESLDYVEDIPQEIMEGQCGYFNNKLTNEEINILATYMVMHWLGQQLASVENTRMKYSGSDFKFTSQANHMQKLLQLKKDYERRGFHLQRLYKRRKISDSGRVKSTMNIIMAPLTEEA